MQNKNYDFIKPLYSKYASIDAMAKALVNSIKRCKQTITLNEATAQIKAYKKRHNNKGESN